MVQPGTYKYAAAEGSKGTSCAQPEVGPKEMAYMEDGKAALAELSVCVLGSLPPPHLRVPRAGGSPSQEDTRGRFWL